MAPPNSPTYTNSAPRDTALTTWRSGAVWKSDTSALSNLDLGVGCHWLCQCPTYEYRPFLNTGGANGTRIFGFDKAVDLPRQLMGD